MSMTLETIRAAHARIAPYIVQTPLLRLPALDDALGCEVYVKAECMQRTGAFKLRGAMNKILTLTDALVAQMPGDVCFPYVAANTDGFAAVADDAILRGMKLLLLEGKLLCEPSSAIGIGAALCGRLPVREGDKVCFVVSGGSVALEQLHQLEDVRL